MEFTEIVKLIKNHPDFSTPKKESYGTWVNHVPTGEGWQVEVLKNWGVASALRSLHTPFTILLKVQWYMKAN
jgi:hypothetical protein